MRIGQRLKENWIDRAEDRCTGANTERQRENADDGKSWMIAQLPHCETQIGEKRSDHILPSIRAHLFLDDGRVPQFQPCRSLRIFSGESTRPPGVSCFVEKVLDLFVNLPILLCLARQSTEAMGELACFPRSECGPGTQDRLAINR